MTAHLHREHPELLQAVGRAPDVRGIEVIEVRYRRGEGCCEQDPVRMVVAYFTTEGRLLAEREQDLFAEDGG